MPSAPVPEHSESALAWIAINLIPGIGPSRAQRLLTVFRAPERVFAAPREALTAVPGITPELAARLADLDWQTQAAGELRLARANRCRILTLADEGYPDLLRQVPLPPPVLYLKGEILPTDARAVAVVGCRRPTRYGLDSTRALAGDLAQAGFTVVSGLARGIDTAAHEAALEAGGRTLAVLAHGLNQVYPPENHDLYGRVSAAGAAVSEFPFNWPPSRENFPRRNRLISGLALGTLVVEADLDSGALITARWAVEQSREVFALPGAYDSRQSQGTHALIQEGAKLVTGVHDIIGELAGPLAPRPARKSRETGPPPDLSPEQNKIYSALVSGGLHVDQLAAVCGLPVAELVPELFRLEMQGRIQAAAGGCYYWNK